MDRNQLIGITLIFLLLFVYLQFFAPNPQPKQAMKDTAAQLADTTQNQKGTTTVVAPNATNPNDSLAREQYRRQYGEFAVAATGETRDRGPANQDLRRTPN